MHIIIRTIVYAENEEQAILDAELVFDKICGEGKPFDYFTMFRPEDESPVSGKTRWGNIPPVCEAESEEGKKLIEEGITATRESFMEAVEKVRNTINHYTNEQLLEENPDMFQLYCNALGQYRGSEVYLYDFEGEGIKTKQGLQNALNKYSSLYKEKENPYKNKKVYVVPADAHF